MEVKKHTYRSTVSTTMSRLVDGPRTKTCFRRKMVADLPTNPPVERVPRFGVFSSKDF